MWPHDLPTKLRHYVLLRKRVLANPYLITASLSETNSPQVDMMRNAVVSYIKVLRQYRYAMSITKYFDKFARPFNVIRAPTRAVVSEPNLSLVLSRFRCSSVWVYDPSGNANEDRRDYISGGSYRVNAKAHLSRLCARRR